jgi:hypothetical protein
MRAVWSQAVRPRGSGRIGRATRYQHGHRHRIKPGRPFYPFLEIRHPTFNDAFTVFLAPFLAAATFINLSWKEAQKKEWDQRVQDIDKELDALRAREAELSTRLQLSLLDSRAAARQRRSYSTTAQARTPSLGLQTDAILEELWNDSRSEPTQISKRDALGSFLSDSDATLPPLLQAIDDQPPEFPRFDFSSVSKILSAAEVPDYLWKYERIVAAEFALRIRLQMHINGPRDGISTDPPISDSDPSTDAVIDQLHRVSRLREEARPQTLINTNFIGSTWLPTLTATIDQLFADYQAGKLSSIRFVNGLSDAILDSVQPPNINIYTKLLTLWTDTKLELITPIIVEAIQRSVLAFDEMAMASVIGQAAHTRNPSAFDWCLFQFTKQRGRLRFRHMWRHRQFGDQTLPVPTSGDQHLVKTLLWAALTLEQTSRAEAWMTLVDPEDDPTEYYSIIKKFLRYYAKHSEWRKGRAWIVRLVKAIDRFGPESCELLHFQYLLFRALCLCAACGKRVEYARILQTAAAAGLKPEFDDYELEGAREHHIVAEWTGRLDHEEHDRDMLDKERIVKFQRNSEIISLFSTDIGPDLFEVDMEAGLADIDVDANLLKTAESASNADKAILVNNSETLRAMEDWKAELASSKMHIEAQFEQIHGLQTSVRSLMNRARQKDTNKAKEKESIQLQQQQVKIGLLEKELTEHRMAAERHQEVRIRESADSKAQISDLRQQVAQLAALVKKSTVKQPQDSARDFSAWSLFSTPGSESDRDPASISDSDSDSGYSSGSEHSHHSRTHTYNSRHDRSEAGPKIRYLWRNFSSSFRDEEGTRRPLQAFRNVHDAGPGVPEERV